MSHQNPVCPPPKKKNNLYGKPCKELLDCCNPHNSQSTMCWRMYITPGCVCHCLSINDAGYGHWGIYTLLCVGCYLKTRKKWWAQQKPGPFSLVLEGLLSSCGKQLRRDISAGLDVLRHLTHQVCPVIKTLS